MFSNIGFVLSVSDIEGSHLSPTEAFADLTLSVLINWPGSSYIYPKEIIFNNNEDIVSYILDTYKNEKKYLKTAKFLNEYCINEFSEEYFVNGLNKIFLNETSNRNSFFLSLKEINEEFIENNKINKEKILNQIPNSFIVENEHEINEIIKNNQNKNIEIFLSDKIENYKIKNFYQKYASEHVNIYSIYFLEHLNEAEEFLKRLNKYHNSNKKLK